MHFQINFYCRHCEYPVSLRQDTANSYPLSTAHPPRIPLECSQCHQFSGIMQVNYELPHSMQPEVVAAQSKAIQA